MVEKKCSRCSILESQIKELETQNLNLLAAHEERIQLFCDIMLKLRLQDDFANGNRSSNMPMTIANNYRSLSSPNSNVGISYFEPTERLGLPRHGNGIETESARDCFIRVRTLLDDLEHDIARLDSNSR